MKARLFLTLLCRLALKVSRFITGLGARAGERQESADDDWINDGISNENRIFMNQENLRWKIGSKWAAEHWVIGIKERWKSVALKGKTGSRKMRAKKDHGKARDREQREKYEAFDRLLNCDESIFFEFSARDRL